MTKVSRRVLRPQDYKQIINNLWSAFTLLSTKEDVKSLFKDLLTHTESKMLAKRLHIARLLLEGVRYEVICESLAVTPGTVAAVSNVLIEKGIGYRKAEEKLIAMEEELLKNQKENIKKLENPFRAKLKGYNKTLLGVALKAGMLSVDKKITQKIRADSAKKILDT